MPPYGSGSHRYFFLLYEQNYHINKIDDSENNMAVRCGFNVRHFAEDNSLIGPVALNMFITERKRKSDAKDDEDDDKEEGKKKDGNKKDKSVKIKSEKEKDNAKKEQNKDEKTQANKKDLI